MLARRTSRRAFATALCAAALTLAASAIGSSTASAATATSIVPTETKLVWLHTPHAVRSRPAQSAAVRQTVAARRPITGVRTALPVLGRRVDVERRVWLLVRLPGRTLAQGSLRTGWIRATDTTTTKTAWHLRIDLARRRVIASYDGRAVRSFSVIVGAASTPTPRGQYFVEENVALPRSAVGQPFALATSARSSVLQEYAGGPGQIAFHGTGNVGGVLGTAASHGCIRMSTSGITWLAARIRPGVPITIS